MRILKIKVRRQQTKAGTFYTYPPEYDAEKIQVICYESVLPENYKKVVERGNEEEFLIGVVRDDDASTFLCSSNVQEINREEAVTLGNQWLKQTERIADLGKVLVIMAKVCRGESLNQREKDALDPNKPEQGINLSRSIEDILQELATKL